MPGADPRDKILCVTGHAWEGNPIDGYECTRCHVHEVDLWRTAELYQDAARLVPDPSEPLAMPEGATVSRAALDVAPWRESDRPCAACGRHRLVCTVEGREFCFVCAAPWEPEQPLVTTEPGPPNWTPLGARVLKLEGSYARISLLITFLLILSAAQLLISIHDLAEAQQAARVHVSEPSGPVEYAPEGWAPVEGLDAVEVDGG